MALSELTKHTPEISSIFEAFNINHPNVAVAEESGLHSVLVTVQFQLPLSC